MKDRDQASEFRTKTEKRKKQKGKKTHLLPNSSSAPQLLPSLFLRLSLVDFDHAAVQLGLIHVVDGLEGVLGLRELDVSKASVGVLGGFPIIVRELVSQNLGFLVVFFFCYYPFSLILEVVRMEGEITIIFPRLERSFQLSTDLQLGLGQ